MRNVPSTARGWGGGDRASFPPPRASHIKAGIGTKKRRVREVKRRNGGNRRGEREGGRAGGNGAFQVRPQER